jgi:hypothetical protein
MFIYDLANSPLLSIPDSAASAIPSAVHFRYYPQIPESPTAEIDWGREETSRLSKNSSRRPNDAGLAIIIQDHSAAEEPRNDGAH